jgi:hypothetical protein
MQFIRPAEDFGDEVGRILEHAERAVQVQVHFWKRLSISGPTYVEEARCYRVQRVGAVGVVSVPRLVEAGFVFPTSERLTGDKARELGMEAYSVSDPWVARIPWAPYVRDGRSLGSKQRKGAPYVLRMLDETEVERLTKRTPTRSHPIDDEYVKPWAWTCWAPYLGVGGSRLTWVRSILRVAFHKRTMSGLRPRRVRG